MTGVVGGLSVGLSTEVGLRTGLEGFWSAKSAAWGWLAWRSDSLVKTGVQVVSVVCQSSNCRKIRGQHGIARTQAKVQAVATSKLLLLGKASKAARSSTRYSECRRDAEIHLDLRRSLDQAAARRNVGDMFLWHCRATFVERHSVEMLRSICWP